MQCPACANENKPGALFCAFCGYALSALAPDDDEPESLQAGQLMDGGTYRIIRPLGKGGMGAVYLAANTKAFDRQCVIKEVIEYYDAADPEERQKAMQRFEIEARILATLKHQGIPDIYAYFSENGRNYLVMEYIEGPDLADGLTREQDDQIVRGGPLKADAVIRYTRQICEVLDYLEKHQPPVIHNDLKPANIIIDGHTGRAVLVDFGTARTRYTIQPPPAAARPGRQQSSIYGTVGYAAPELYDGKAEPRSDVYALAATAYHLLTDDDLRLHPFQFPKMEMIPLALREVLHAALSPKIQDRPTAAELGARLDVLLNQGSRPLPALTFPQGDQAASRREMIDLSIKHWDYATDILYDGSITRWLNDAIHDPAAVRAAEEATRRYADDHNAGLEYFVRTLDPKAMPVPQLKVLSGRLSYDNITGTDNSQQIEVKNTGGGYLYGTVKSSEQWVEVPGKLACAPGQSQTLPVIVRTAELTSGRIYQAKVEIQASGAQSAVIPIEVKVPPPIVDVSPTHIDLRSLGKGQLFTERGSFEVRNRGKVAAQCQIDGNPDWLVLDPIRCTVNPGETRAIDLVGRADKLPQDPRGRLATLQVKIAGIQPRPVTVAVRSNAPQESRLGSTIMIGCAVVVLIAALIWFALTVLPLLP
ncbi:MAG: protein kinase [Anaerolineae bacterium]|nr:protein kinase [Anaerolineae bacterium]